MRSKGYSQLARALTERLGQPVSRQRVHSWVKAGTVNICGEPFPGTENVTEAEAWVRIGVRRGRGDARNKLLT